MSVTIILIAIPDEIRARWANLCGNSDSAMLSFVWHKEQERLSDCLTAIIWMAVTCESPCPHIATQQAQSGSNVQISVEFSFPSH